MTSITAFLVRLSVSLSQLPPSFLEFRDDGGFILPLRKQTYGQGSKFTQRFG